MFGIPESRIRIEYISYVSGAKEKKELPLRLLVLGDYIPKEAGTDGILAEKEKLRVDSNNLNEVMANQNISLRLTMPNHLTTEMGAEMTVDLNFDGLNAFCPEAVVSQVEKLGMILEIRDLLEEMSPLEVNAGRKAILTRLLARIDSAPRPQAERASMVGLAIDLLGSERVDEESTDTCITELDKAFGVQLDEILHHEKFQQLESAWRALHFLLDRTAADNNAIVEILSVSKEELAEDFAEAGDPLQGGLFVQTYTQAYDQYGADPISLMVADYEFDNSQMDIELLRDIADVAAAAQCPFIASASPQFFGVSMFEELDQVPSLKAIMESPSYRDWNSFREYDNSQYIGLVLPQFMLRLPYDRDTAELKNIDYSEDVKAGDHDKYLWGKSSFAFAANISRSFINYGWPVNIVGTQSGGMVENLPLHVYEQDNLVDVYRIPLEIKIPDMKEREWAEYGFIPLLIHEGTGTAACFFSANSTHSPLAVGVPSMLLLTRIVHYLRVIQRDELGRRLNTEQVQTGLNEWLDQYVCGFDAGSERLRAEKPFATARVNVQKGFEESGILDVQLLVAPHHQLNEPGAELSLVAKMPEAR